MNLLPFEGDEAIAAVLPIKEFTDGHYLIFVRRAATSKRQTFCHLRSHVLGLIALTIDDDDSLIGVDHTDGSNEIIIGTRMGMAIRFSEEDVRAMGRTAGVRSINLKKDDDTVVGMVVVREDFHTLEYQRTRLRKASGL